MIVGLQIADVQHFEHLMDTKSYTNHLYVVIKHSQAVASHGNLRNVTATARYRKYSNITGNATASPLRKPIAAWQRDGRRNGERNSIASVIVQRDGSTHAAIASIAANMRSYAAESPLRARFPTGASFRAQARIPGIWDP